MDTDFGRRAHRQRHRAPGRGRAAQAARRPAARGPRAHRHQRRLRARRVRLVHRARRRGQRPLVPDARRAGATAPTSSPSRAWRPATGAAPACSRRSSTRRPSSAGSARRASSSTTGAARPQPEAVGGRDPRGALGQPLPLHGLPAHRRRRSSAAAERDGMTRHEPTTQHSTAWVGTDVPRKEDPALLRGPIAYIDDLRLPGMLHAAVLRCRTRTPGSCAIDTSGGAGPARRASPCSPARIASRSSARCPRFCAEAVVEYAIAVEKVRYFGEAVAAVAAESPLHRRGRARAHRGRVRAAARRDRRRGRDGRGRRARARQPRLERRLPEAFTFGDVDADFAAADRVMRRELRWPRATPRRWRPPAPSSGSTRRAGGWTSGRTPT